MRIDEDWIFVADDSGLLEGTMKPVDPPGVHLLLSRVAGSAYALSPENVFIGPVPYITLRLKGIGTPFKPVRLRLRVDRYGLSSKNESTVNTLHLNFQHHGHPQN